MHILIIIAHRQAASLGISVTPEPSYSNTFYRPYRGRGRGARGGYYRGAMRGGPPRTSMKLDNRPKKLLVKGASPESLQAVRDWYEVRTVVCCDFLFAMTSVLMAGVCRRLGRSSWSRRRTAVTSWSHSGPVLPQSRCVPSVCCVGTAGSDICVAK